MRAKRPKAPERAEGKPLPEGMVLMKLTEGERLVIELLRDNDASPDPEDFNQVALKMMLEVENRQGLSPQQVEDRTGIQHQYHRKMHPTEPGSLEPHVTLFTVQRWCRGVHFSALRLVAMILVKLRKKRRLTSSMERAKTG